MSFTLERGALIDLFPAFMLVEPGGRVVEAGPSIVRHFPDLAGGGRLQEVFAFASPGDRALPESLQDLSGIVRIRSRDGRYTLRGAVVPQADGKLLLCVSHAVSGLHDAEEGGLKIADFSKTDASVTSLLIVALQESLLRETKAAVAELAAARDQALVAARSQAAFLSNMSHEIRTPLTGLIGFSELLAALPDLPQPAMDYAQKVATASRGVFNIVDTVLEYSAIESGRVVIRAELNDPSEVAAQVLRVLEFDAGQKGLELALEVAPDTPRLVSCDPRRLWQVMLNLASNAVKFTPAGTVKVKLAADPAGAGDGLLVRVIDQGPGVAPQDADRLFRRFSRLDAALNRRTGGTGLGLAISKGLIELMGGEIGFENNSGQGACFWFRIPAGAAGGREVGVPADGRPGLEAGAAPSGARLLVVDDVAMNRELMSACLRGAGYQVVEAASGSQGVRACSELPFDCILMDVHMAGMDGIAAMAAIRSGGLNAGTPIIAFSADVTLATIEMCQQAGATEFLPKPARTSMLLERVAAWARPPGAREP